MGTLARPAAGCSQVTSPPPPPPFLCACYLQTVRQARLRRTQQQLERAAFLATPTFCGALLEIGALMDGLRGIQVGSCTGGL